MKLILAISVLSVDDGSAVLDRVVPEKKGRVVRIEMKELLVLLGSLLVSLHGHVVNIAVVVSLRDVVGGVFNRIVISHFEEIFQLEGGHK